MKILVTGTAGFIGFHTALKLLARGDEVVGFDNINDYYDVRLKHGRLRECGIEPDQAEYGKLIRSNKYEKYSFIKATLEDKATIDKLFADQHFDAVCHLAAQAGVRYSLTNPQTYIDSNITGTLNILEACRFNPVRHLVYASSSSVYGLNKEMPFSTKAGVDHPISLYAASKKSNELMAHTYSHLFGIPTTGLRFFTVYGPWGRPDMALFIFTKAILEGKPIDIYNHGKMKRDFTYVDDIVEGVIRVIDSPAKGVIATDQITPATSSAPYRVYNIGNSNPVELMDFVTAIEKYTGKIAHKNLMPIQAGDVPATWADTTDLENELGYKPNMSVDIGIRNFINWYREFYGV